MGEQVARVFEDLIAAVYRFINRRWVWYRLPFSACGR
jgi:hypothetical protein